jgi:hypothetical protein
MQTTLEPILELLDEGLRLYRRSFAPLLVLASLLALPLGLAAAALVISADWLASGFGGLVATLALVAGLPLSLYVMGALSRAALMAADGGPVRLRAALAIGPLRVAGMGCYGTLFSIAASVAVSAVTTACVCGAYLAAAAIIGAAMAFGTASNPAATAMTGFLAVVGVLVFFAIYAASLVLNGAIYSSVIYALQPFVHERARLGATIGRSFELLGFRLGQNLLAFLGASLVFGAGAIAATLAIGVLAPLPALFLLGAESLVARAITAAAWVCGVSAAIPLLPIWMALLYRRRAAARQGADLEAQLDALAAGEPEAAALPAAP